MLFAACPIRPMMLQTKSESMTLRALLQTLLPQRPNRPRGWKDEHRLE